MSPGLLQDFMDGQKTLRLSLISACCGCECEIESYEKAIFDFRFMKFVFRISGGINCWDPVEDSDTGGPSSIMVRTEYLLAFQY